MQIEQVNRFNYFGTSKIGLDLRKRLSKCHIWSVLLYGCESWTVSKNTVNKLEEIEMWFWRRMVRISWIEKMTNEEVLPNI